MQYPISEIFTSPQGEGQWAGTMMTFIRLAGCSVGRPFSKEAREEFENKLNEGKPQVGIDLDTGRHENLRQLLPIYTEQCTLYDGRKFACDTDYRVKERLTPEEIRQRCTYAGVGHVCITGGEPLIHDLTPLLSALQFGYMIHIETSGTIDIRTRVERHLFQRLRSDGDIWITVSPKFGSLSEMVAAADEVKLLVDAEFDPKTQPEGVHCHNRVYLQPVNYEHEVNADNLRLCREWQDKYPHWRVCLQLHKVLEHYLKERVR